MSQPQHKPPFDTPITSIDAYYVVVLQEEAEIKQEQINSLKTELLEKEQLVQYLEAELRDINNDLLAMNAELLAAYQTRPISFDQAKEVAKTILTSQKSTEESLSQLLSAINGSRLEAAELKQKPIPMLLSNLKIAQEHFLPERKSLDALIRTQIEELLTKMTALRTQMATLKASSRQLKNVTKSEWLHGKST